jgi:hypothetical protein
MREVFLQEALTARILRSISRGVSRQLFIIDRLSATTFFHERKAPDELSTPDAFVLIRFLSAMVVFVIALTLLIKGSSGPMSAQQAPTQQERQFENRIAKHVPLEVKQRKGEELERP